MQTHSEKKVSPLADQSEKKQQDVSVIGFADNRPVAAIQRRLREAVDNSPQTGKTAQFQAMAEEYTSQQNSLVQKKENRTGMPDELKSGVENLSGYSMDDVNVHYNSNKPTQLNAHAYAQGSDIHIASGQEKHLPHEAWHVVQQKQGRVKPTMQMKGGVNVNDDTGLEQEADVMGAKAVQMRSVVTPNQLPATSNRKTIQYKRHKPQLNSKVRYNAGGAAGPNVGEICTVTAVADDGGLTLVRDRDAHNYAQKDWKTDPIWLMYAADAKDTDMRQTDVAWGALTKAQKTAIYTAAKEQAVEHIKTSASAGMLNATNSGNLDANLTMGFFEKIKKGEWQTTWTEPNANGRKWQFTIDMDDPLETSWQAAHVGWEVKILVRGTNHADPPVTHPNFAKQQGHVWLNQVPEARDAG